MIKIYIGKSAAGKDTLMQNDIKNGISPIVSFTSRPMRVGEVEGREYHFVSKKNILASKEQGKFCEFREYHTKFNGKADTWYYASPAVDANKNWVTILDVNGAKSYIEFYGSKNIEVVYVDVPDDIREMRAKSRGSFDKTEWDRRLADDNKVFAEENIAELKGKLNKDIIVVENY